MTAPSHVLMTADTLGGVWTYSLELAAALATHRTRVSLAAMGAPVTDSQRRQAAAVPGLSLYESTYKLEWMDDPWADVDEAGEWLLSLARRLQPDVVHLNGFVHGSLPWSVPSIVVAHSCVFSWWNAVFGTDPPEAWTTYQSLVSAGLSGADTVVAVSRFMADALQAHYNFGSAIVVPNAGNAESFSVASKEPFILTSGRAWDEAKNIRMLDTVAPSLAWPVCVAGETRHPDGGLTTLAHVTELGQLSQPCMRDWLSRAAIYALPARYEPFGLSVVEAALSGCALVLGDTASLRELWHGAALFVPPGDAASLTSAIESLIFSQSLRETLAQRARERAMHFTPERMLAGYLDVYSGARKAQPSCA